MQPINTVALTCSEPEGNEKDNKKHVQHIGSLVSNHSHSGGVSGAYLESKYTVFLKRGRSVISMVTSDFYVLLLSYYK